MAQDPGPPGWPQVPQAAAAESATGFCVAKTDSFLSNSALEQRAQVGVSAPRTSVSNSCEQARHVNSKIGTGAF